MNKDQIAAERLYLNKDRTKVVPEGTEAAFLYANVGDTIPEHSCKRFGIVDGKLKGKKADKAAPTPTSTPTPTPTPAAKKKPAAKEKAAPANKEKAAAENKGADAGAQTK